MKIAIGTDDKKTIRRAHFGESKYYLVYEILNGEIISKEFRENPHVCTGEHAHGQAKKIMDLLPDCHLIIGRSMGKKSMDQIAKKNIDVIVTKLKNIEKTIQLYLDSNDEYFKYYDDETGKFCNCADR